MSTVVLCEDCGSVIERYENDQPYEEHFDGLCSRCEGVEYGDYGVA